MESGEAHNFCRSPNIVRVIKSESFGWAGHVVRMEEGIIALKMLTVKLSGKRMF